jgi:hypothetical protein
MAAPPGRFAQHLAALPVDAREHTADDVERALASPSLAACRRCCRRRRRRGWRTSRSGARRDAAAVRPGGAAVRAAVREQRLPELVHLLRLQQGAWTSRAAP